LFAPFGISPHTAPTIGKGICWGQSFYFPTVPCPSMSTIETAIAGST
jgi:hypothetical protein